MLPWIPTPPLERTFLRPHGQIVDAIDLPLVDAVVRAGTPTAPAEQASPKRARYIRFLITDDWLSDLNVAAGDTLYIDVSFDDRCHDREIVLVRTHFGLQVGRYRSVGRVTWIDLLDGSRARMIVTPEMEIVGTVAHMKRDPGWGRYEDGKEGVMF